MKKHKGKILLILFILVTGAVSTGFLTSQETRDFRIAKNLDIFFTLFRELNTFYVDEIDPDKVIKTGIDNMLKTLDPYTVYFPESDADEFRILTTGKYGGIGSLIRSGGDYTVITDVYKAFPADVAGIKAGDLLKKVDGISLKGLSTDKVSEKLKGNPGTEISLTIERNGKDNDYSLKREKIVMPPVPYWGMIDSKTGYIRFTNFTQNCIEDVKTALTSLKEKNAQQIILDLRGNPGGLLTEAVGIVNLFVGEGNEVVSTKGKVKQFDEDFKTSKQPVDEKIPLAVIINRGSASASEIVAGALQDLDRAVIVGQRSYGKGLVQTTRPVSYNSQLKVTTAKYYIPSGRCIQAVDYSHRNEDGSVGYIPDSLINEFTTLHGRKVFDGGGIAPDIQLEATPVSDIAISLFSKSLIFDYATIYSANNPNVANVADLKLDDADYGNFVEFLKGKDYDYKTDTDDKLEQLIKAAKQDKYYDGALSEFTQLKTKLAHDKDKDLQTFKPEIESLLYEEIASRYFYQKGRIQAALVEDPELAKAVEILKNPESYAMVFSKSFGANNRRVGMQKLEN